MEPISAKIAEKALQPDASQNKLQSSQSFERTLVEKKNAAEAGGGAPTPVSRISEEQQAHLLTQLRMKVQQTSSTNPSQLFSREMQSVHQKLTSVAQRVSALPRVPAFDGLRNHLQNLEAQYRNSGNLLHSLGPDAKLQDLLHLQEDMYLMTQNLEVFSRVVDQTTSGVKTILQTQV